MSRTVLVLGANGRFGRAAVAAFSDAGWTVRALARRQPVAPSVVDWRVGDALDPDSLIKVADGCGIIVNAVNVAYHQWSATTPRLTRSVLQAAERSRASVIIPGNVYVYGAGMPDELSETTPHRPTTPQGRLRMDMEASYRAACEAGRARAILLRGGDFIEGAKTGNWFDSQIMANLSKGRMMYPGPTDLAHAWAYLPDMARAAARLADKAASLPAYAEFGFAGYTMTGADLLAIAERATGKRLKLAKAPWGAIRMLGLVSGDMKAVGQMSYLWRTPHGIIGDKFALALPGFRETPRDDAIGSCIELLMRATRT